MFVEPVRALRASPVISTLATAIAAAATAVILLATTETLQAERAILESLEAPDLRLVILRDVDGSAGLPPQAAARIQALSTVEWAFGLGEAEDVSVFEGGVRTHLRALFGTPPSSLRLPPTFYRGHIALGTEAVADIGLLDGLGTVSSEAHSYSAGGSFSVSEPLGFLANGAIRPARAGEEPSQIVLLVSNIRAMDSTVRLAVDASGSSTPNRVAASVPDDIGHIRAAIQGVTGRSGRRLTQLILGGSGSLLALITSTGVLLRRTDLGRRRALGATRGYILRLVLSQAAITSSVGSLGGAAITHLYRWLSSQPVPSLQFSLAVSILVTTASMLAALIPAIVASNSDPIRVLRVP